MAIGGETTGWRLKYKEDGKEKSIEVDMSGIEVPDVFEGKDIRVIGEAVTKSYVERDPVMVLKAEPIQVGR